MAYFGLCLRLVSGIRPPLRPNQRAFHSSWAHAKSKVDVRVQYPYELKSSSSSNQEKILPTNSGKELVVVLLGWAGAEHRHLSKYSDYYLKRGAITMRYITPLRYHFIGTHNLPKLARGVLAEIKNLGFIQHPIFFHVFSNGGSNAYSYILREMGNSENRLKFDIKGTIFDSSPAPRNLQSLIGAGLNIYSNRHFVFVVKIRYAMVGTAITILACQIFWFHIKAAAIFCVKGESLDALEFPEKNPIPLSNWLEIIANSKYNNFLFIFSNKDDLIPATEVNRFSRICESRGCRVKRVRFEDSEHVMHFRKYPKEYSDALICFIRETIMQDEFAN